MGTRPLQRTGAAAGVTLVELVLTLAILVTLAGLALPRMANAQARQRAAVAAQRVALDLRRAAAAARHASAARMVVFDTSGHRYTLRGVPTLDRTGADDTVVLTADPYRVQLASVDCGGDAELVFDGYGRPDSAAVVVVIAGRFSRSVVVDAAGGVSTP